MSSSSRVLSCIYLATSARILLLRQFSYVTTMSKKSTRQATRATTAAAPGPATSTAPAVPDPDAIVIDRADEVLPEPPKEGKFTYPPHVMMT